MNYLVIGGNGFIGSNLTKFLLKKGHKVTVVDTAPSSYGIEYIDRVDYAQLDASGNDFVNRFKYTKFNGIFNFGFACSVIQYKENPFDSMNKTIIGHMNCLKLSKLTETKYVYASSGNVYGRAFPNNELTKPEPNNLYGLTKHILEKLCESEDICKMPYDKRPVGLRIFAGYGPGEEKKGRLASVVTLFLNDLLSKKTPVIWGNGLQTRDFVYIDDIVEAAYNSCHRSMNGVVNVGTGISTTFNELVTTIGDELNVNVLCEYVDKPNDYVEATKADTNRMSSILNEVTTLESGVKKLINYRKSIQKQTYS
jgi:nucleoside-diphosphate-sugar epimerase